MGVYTCVPRFELWPPLPPLLDGATAKYGNWIGCAGGDAVSPELEQRLARQFPPGSPESVLVASLAEQHFATPSPCRNDSSVRFSYYLGPKGSKPGRGPVDATVYWKVNDASQIVWTHGYLHFIFL